MTESDIEVDLDNENGTAVIRGKTNVPFRTFVTLILQRKIQGLVKEWKDEPVVVSSELLTSLASAPDEKQEDRGKLIVVTLATGLYLGIVLTVAILLVLSVAGTTPRVMELAIVLGLLVAFSGLVVLTQRLQRTSKKRESLVEKMERLTELLSK